MIAIDTNVLIRILIDDPSALEQCETARSFVVQAECLWISQVVLIETLWVLESAYHFKKLDILMILEKITLHPQINVESSRRVSKAISLYAAHSVDFSDCLILSAALDQKLILHTFDRKLSKLDGAELLA